jgi:hypothetical protein
MEMHAAKLYSINLGCAVAVWFKSGIGDAIFTAQKPLKNSITNDKIKPIILF